MCTSARQYSRVVVAARTHPGRVAALKEIFIMPKKAYRPCDDAHKVRFATHSNLSADGRCSRSEEGHPRSPKPHHGPSSTIFHMRDPGEMAIIATLYWRSAEAPDQVGVDGLEPPGINPTRGRRTALASRARQTPYAGPLEPDRFVYSSDDRA